MNRIAVKVEWYEKEGAVHVASMSLIILQTEVQSAIKRFEDALALDPTKTDARRFIKVCELH